MRMASLNSIRAAVLIEIHLFFLNKDSGLFQESW